MHVSNSVGMCENEEEARGAGDEAAGGANKCIKLLIILFSRNSSEMKFLPSGFLKGNCQDFEDGFHSLSLHCPLVPTAGQKSYVHLQAVHLREFFLICNELNVYT